MPRHLDYFLSLSSPWAYMGHAILLDIARRHELSLTYKPVFLGNIFAETGGLPLPKRHPARQRYRLVELQRWRERRNLSFNVRPKFWPFDVNTADRFVAAVAMSGADPGAFIGRAFAAIWEKEQNLGDEAVILRLAQEAGLDGPALLRVAKSDAAEAAYEQNFRDAVSADVFGSPSYVLDGEVFWGQDRLDFLEEALQNRRLPYSSVV
ncbi:2-hydroxychromene-2-carboxylate isomerase [Labrys wisconsinensis]|uniref:2-hydroxychromene-2-carboxylate isomerase n=1 Tax=Labrys wisconsinensis TaxID=425677 RepID=A0ABU0JDK6_9HYPH|nr:2-hydroxychromene-2-carboxylate isomerase [Labrys wisconsinensis]MDQ0472358.1 2-hydroxychromene-2-carboxylate isomerase [Labrys wisconsinensis]